ncbi:hypothetical protein bwei_5773 [Bacillus mycoides]|uniref:hypothetical protein n=1 Tax=Bacillus mycoides TaxID=1405 RepID=UPI0002F1F388|nr:hypothetical protein [Bacillus mycoides]AIW88282.1 hypothetical protein bwei_5773 [Bacillus mycoides]GAE43237.1 hypothetical protein BW1_083_00090 [Bacillus mycoides NBRC 101238 = DSM 11821]
MDLCIFLYIPILAWVLGFSFVTGLAEKLYKILHALSVVLSELLAVSPITLTIRQSEEQKELVGIPTSSFSDNV